ncbi:hypothetical protein BJX63DRAFT_315547 [Aspergillus granulosus]|uniref:Secreted protein n=1 Tax=Aspergillus granulosus TaxID=176169 RepID=A0ABR4H4S5_9EURO
MRAGSPQLLLLLVDRLLTSRPAALWSSMHHRCLSRRKPPLDPGPETRKRQTRKPLPGNTIGIIGRCRGDNSKAIGRCDPVVGQSTLDYCVPAFPAILRVRVSCCQNHLHLLQPPLFDQVNSLWRAS